MERNLFKRKVTENQSSSSSPSSPPTMSPPSRPTSFIPKHTSSSFSDNRISSSIQQQNDEAFKPEVDYASHGLEQHDVAVEGRGVFRMYTMNHLHHQNTNNEQSNTNTTTTTSLPAHLIKTRKCESVLVFIHGAGLSSLSWTLCMQNLRQLVIRSGNTNNVNINFMRSPPTPIEMGMGQPKSASEAFNVDDYEYCAMDLRGHGASHTEKDSELSIDTLVDDIIALLQQVYRGKKRNFILIGHSLGGSIAVRCAHKMDIIEEQETKSGTVQSHELMTVKGVVVIDMVEGSALTSLPNTKKFIESRPNKFKNMESAIKWSIQHGVVNNISSAVISIPSQLMHVEEGNYYTWRTNLTDSEEYWTAWFTDMSQIFLEVKGLKLLMITSTDILDKELTIAQMQGKFQMKVLNRSGHCIQEDDPAHCSEVIFSFLHRFRL
ncbi:predicted protein [Naegleria gruberi]|uniref:Protein phosphatase methylesterase 1 n=1 Tax=Naegleria gruberi TaxID=5762 RepID=D2VR44_NAEGR|nr:uncharacterized protein NAEGRDRAFT_71456 [Naegleria gruberi]EFC40742.1 predicted protein [Naegleria gruberi]|eukprot:XP_002673486.1 predicted protein [Naegleria gruberi strain NEG-M]